jgi:hypothetical protein
LYKETEPQGTASFWWSWSRNGSGSSFEGSSSEGSGSRKLKFNNPNQIFYSNFNQKIRRNNVPTFMLDFLLLLNTLASCVGTYREEPELSDLETLEPQQNFLLRAGAAQQLRGSATLFVETYLILYIFIS